MEQDQEQPMEHREQHKTPDEEMKEYVDNLNRENQRTSEAIHDGFTIVAEKLADMLDVRDPEERFKLVEGYRALISTFMPRPVSIQMPGRPVAMYPGAMGMGPMPGIPGPTKQPDPNCVTIEGKRKHIVLLDWVCILQRTFKLTFDIEDDQGDEFAAHLEFYHGGDLYLNRPQAKHLARYLNDLDQNGGMMMGPYGNRSPKAFLALPVVQALINEED